MELYTLKINVTNQRLSFGENPPEIFSGDQSIDFVEFTFTDDTWNFPDIWAIFSRQKGPAYQIALDDNKVMIPAEVMQKRGYVYIGLMATDGENVQTSNVLQYSIGQGAANVETVTPSPSIYEQFLNDLEEYQEAIHNLETLAATAETLPAGSDATASYVNGVLQLGIPKGDTGATGNGIQSIAKTSTSGSVDTYTITFTNGNTTTFDVTNGEVTEKQFDNVINEINSLENLEDEIVNIQWEHGGIDETTGLTVSDGSLVRSRCITYYKESDIAYVENNSASTFWVIYYTENDGVYTFSHSLSVAASGGYGFSADSNYYLRFDIRGGFSEAELANIYYRNSTLFNQVESNTIKATAAAPLVAYNEVPFLNPVIGTFQGGVYNPNSRDGICTNDLYNGDGFTAEIETGYTFYTLLYTYPGGVYTGILNTYTGTATIPPTASNRGYKFQLVKNGGLYSAKQQAYPERTLDEFLKIYTSNKTVVYSNELNSGGFSVPQYWESTLDSKESAIMSLQDNGFDSFSFIFITDLHWGNNSQVSPALVNDISKNCNIPILVNGGDLTAGGVVEKTEIEKELKTVCEVLDRIPITRLTCIGNHDDNSITGLFAKTLNNKEKYNYIERYTENYIGQIHYGETGTYYYLDDIAHKVRYIITDCYNLIYQDDGNGGLVYSSMTSGGLGVYRQDQIDWFANVALDVPDNDWSVIVFSHNPANQGTMINDYLMLNVLDAFNNQNAWSGTSLPGVTDPNYICSISVDYQNKGGTVIGWFSGHTHTDSFVTSTYSFPIIVTTCDTMDANKTAGTTSEQAFDVVTVNKLTKTINMTRVGYGSDRNTTY
ncbi:MAG: metallophosphoesterase [Methanobrevibacter sp.]|nr:metallophosphoesterase [Methanobrevibacter sp.]